MNQDTSRPSTDDLLNHIEAIDLFGGLNEAILHALADNAEWVVLETGEILFRQGDPSDAMYIVVSGRLQVSITEEDETEKVVAEIEQGELVGEIQVLTGGERTASISASQDAELIKFSKSTFEWFANRESELIQQVNVIIRRRLQHNQLAFILPKLFGTLAKDELQAIEAKAEWVQIQRGKDLFRQGEPGDSFCILVSGCLGVAIEDEDGNRQMVNQIRRGEIVGEMSLLTDDNRSASVYAIRDAELARFSKIEFNRLLEKYPKLLMQIARMIVNRLRQANISSKIISDSTIIAVLPASPDVPLSDFVNRLTAELSSLHPTLHVSSERLDHFLGTPGISELSEDNPNNIRISAWMNSQEGKHRFIVYETDMSVSNWTRRSIRQADQILIVGQATANSDLGEIEAELLYSENDTTTRQVLILLHPNGSQQLSGTKQWLDVRRIEMHHHVRWDTNADFQRVARFIAGTAVGLALSGGGARGFAHIGVIRALEEAGIPIDMIGGTSMGALIAAEYSLGWDCETMTDISSQNVSKMIYDLTLPISSLFAGRKLVNRLKNFFGDACIEDLWLPYFCVSSNLTRAEMAIHRTGALWRSLQASNAAPGLFPPVVLNGDLHVDGALLSNLPADVMNKLCEGTVIAVDVSPPVDLAENPAYGNALSGWRILWSKINPFAKPITLPDIRTILQRAGELSSVANQKSVIDNMADLYIRVPVEKYHLQDYKSAGNIIEDGYCFAKQKIEQWNQKT